MTPSPELLEKARGIFTECIVNYRSAPLNKNKFERWLNEHAERILTLGMAAGAEEEREACAETAEEKITNGTHDAADYACDDICRGIAKAIRARSSAKHSEG